MAEITVTRIHETGSESQSLLAELETLKNRIREYAYGIFQLRGSEDGSALEHWLEAERDLTINVASDLVENNTEFQLGVAVAGFDANDLKVTALPGAIVVQGKALMSQASGEKALFSRFELPIAIDIDQVTARLKDGILLISAPKAVLNVTTTERRAPGSEKAAAANAAAA
jgi:HSP20 family molecular chaperone IbpA